MLIVRNLGNFLQSVLIVLSPVPYLNNLYHSGNDTSFECEAEVLLFFGAVVVEGIPDLEKGVESLTLKLLPLNKNGS